VVFVSGGIENDGAIRTASGSTVLASGGTVRLDFAGDGLVQVAVEKQVLEQVRNPAGVPLTSAIRNTGTCDAEGGAVIISAEAASGIFESLINQEGIIKARSLTDHDGTVVLASGSDGIIQNSGTIDVSAAEEGASGGNVSISGSKVGQFGQVHADAMEANAGAIELQAKEAVDIGSGSITTANAGRNGNGGNVIIFSCDTALVRPSSRIEARGGTLSGDGGLIEVSGRKHVEVFGIADAGASNGRSGLFFLDPYNITIQDGAGTLDGLAPNFTANALSSTVSDDAIEAQLNGGTSVLIQTCDGAEPTQEGDIVGNANAAINKTAGGNAALTLKAADDIILNGQIVSTSGALTVNLAANSPDGGTPSGTGDVDINAAITTNGGSVTASGINFDNTGGTITTKGGAVTIDNTGNVTAGNAINTEDGTGGGISFTNPGLLTLTGDLSTDEANVTVGGGNDIVIAPLTSLWISTDKDFNGAAGSINLGSSNIYAATPGKNLALDVRGGTDSGIVTLGPVDDNAGANQFINLLIIYSSHNRTADLQSITTAGNLTLYARPVLHGNLTSLMGSIDINDIATLAADVVVTSGGGAGDDITCYIINDNAMGAHDLTFNAGAGNIDANHIGGSAYPASFTVTSANQAQLDYVRSTGDITVTADAIELTSSPYQSTVSGSITFAGDVELNYAVQPVWIGAYGGTANDDITFTGTVNGGSDLQLDAGGEVTFNGAVGNTAAVGDGTGAAITISSGAVTFEDTVAVASGISQANGIGTLTFKDDVTIAAGNTASTFNSNVALDGLTLTSTGAVTFGNASTDALTVSGAPVTISTAGAGVNQTYNSRVDGTQGLGIETGAGALAIASSAAIGGVSPLDYLSITANALNAFDENITTSGANGISITISGAGGAITQGAGTLSTGGNPVVLQADVMNLGGAINAGASTVALQQTTNGRQIDLGTDTAGTLGLTDAELDRITAGSIAVGNNNAGTVTITDTIHPANSPGISVTTGGDILDGNGDADNIVATADSTLWAAGTIGTADDALEVQINGGDLSIYAEGVSDGVSVNIAGTVLPSNTLNFLNTPPGDGFLNDVLVGGTPEEEPISAAAVKRMPSFMTAISQLNPFIAAVKPLFPESCAVVGWSALAEAAANDFIEIAKNYSP
jgi:hypothetical protein